jgi:hypothetical protein
MVMAKATFRIAADGTAVLDADAPLPLFGLDQPTTLGLLPRDDLPRFDEEPFEVIVLGVAHAIGDRPVHEMTVSLSVGDVRRAIRVVGDRVWEARDGTARIGKPAVFSTMPLVWERAFGGRAAVAVDDDLILDVADTRNPVGKGFDSVGFARPLSRLYSAPDAFPRALDTGRALPNLERPDAPVRSFDDAPLPTCWATVPMEWTLRAAYHLKEKQPFQLSDVALYRAHPDWVIDRPPQAARVVLDGFSAKGAIRFQLPRLRLVVDYALDGRSGRRELIPQMLVLLPGERRFCLTFRRRIITPAGATRQPSLRLRMTEGWRRQEVSS